MEKICEKWVYSFNGPKKTEGNKDMKEILGGKGANLAEMSSLHLPVPPGFTISTKACSDFYRHNQSLAPEIQDEIIMSIREIESLGNKKFGDPGCPLLFSIRSGARASMPGMMDTILNLGLNDQTVLGLAQNTHNERFAWDSYRRFIQMYADVVMGISRSLLEAMLEDLKDARGVKEDTELTAEDFKELIAVYKKMIVQEGGEIFPQDPFEQLWGAISAVFNSWHNRRAIRYRELHGIPHDWGTAVNVQVMVFGNMGEDSATGVCFTRDPSTGDQRFFGEYLLNAQGEDVVAGIRTPLPINKQSLKSQHRSRIIEGSKDEHLQEQNEYLSLEEKMPQIYQELVEIYKRLEQHYRDMQDIEFTIERGKLYILQTRSGKRTVNAALKIAVEMVQEGLISIEEALMRISPQDLAKVLHPRLDEGAVIDVLTSGLPASPGAAVGQIFFNADDVQMAHSEGKKCLLVRIETSPEDIGGMAVAEGILTNRGGMTSHAAVVARGMGIPCVAGCSSLFIDYKNKILKVGTRTFNEGDYLTIDGSTGNVIAGSIPLLQVEISHDFSSFMKWADQKKRLQVRTNADTPEDAEMAVKFGAEGIGLCRTEHMFFDPERILAVRQMIFAEDTSERENALAKLLPFQRGDFERLFRTLAGRPVNIRLLDPPLHEFLPQGTPEMEILAKSLKIDLQTVEERIKNLHEANPMLGHRGCRLGITYPEIYKMQIKAILEAAIVVENSGVKVRPEIMVPLIVDCKELIIIKNFIEGVAQEIFETTGKKIDFKVGTMIETPRAALLAADIAQQAQFFSFGTNDLTQTTFGLSRDDSSKFLAKYLGEGIFAADPFAELDQEGVGELMKMAVAAGRKVSPQLHIGICGEHGGDPKSIEFFHQIGLDYVSCSPYRVAIARLAAAQANMSTQYRGGYSTH